MAPHFLLPEGIVMGLIELIVILAVLGCVWYLIVTYIPMPGPIKTIITVIAVIALCILLLGMIGFDTGIRTNVGNVHL